MPQPKLCPMQSISGRVPKLCEKDKCAWWTGAYTTESIMIYECAVVIIAMKNQDGHIVV